jgi:hypothetical protein
MSTGMLSDRLGPHSIDTLDDLKLGFSSDELPVDMMDGLLVAILCSLYIHKLCGLSP